MMASNLSMMKYMALGISALFFSCRVTSVNQVDLHEPAYFKVYNIDSTEHVYIIYAKQGVCKFTMVSPKVLTNDCRNIVLDGKYYFDLMSISSEEQKRGRNAMDLRDAIYLMGSGCFIVDGLQIKLDDRWCFQELYFIKNVKGLCFDPNWFPQIQQLDQDSHDNGIHAKMQ